MKKTTRVLAAVMSVALIGAVPIPSVPVVAEDVSITDKNQNNTYYIFYKDIDTKEIDEVVAQKRHDYIYSLYEQGLSEQEVEKKSTDYYQEVRLDLVKKAYKEASAKILTELGVDGSDVFCSSYTPLIICSLNEEQLEVAQKSENIREITSFKDFTFEPTSIFNDKNSLIEYFTTDSKGNSVLGDNIKVDAIFNSGQNKNIDYLIVYGLSDVKEIDAVVKELNKGRSYSWESPIDTFSGGIYDLIGSDIKTNNQIKLIVFVDDITPGFAVNDISNYSNDVGFDARKYVINLGDPNGDYSINAVDASIILSTYAKIQTTNDYIMSEDEIKKMDVNNDGSVDAVDASCVLSYYAFISTDGTVVLKDYLKKAASNEDNNKSSNSKSATPGAVHTTLNVSYDEAKERFGHTIKKCSRSDFLGYKVGIVSQNGNIDSKEAFCWDLTYEFKNGYIYIQDQDRSAGKLANPGIEQYDYLDRTFVTENSDDDEHIRIGYYPTDMDGLAYCAIFDKSVDIYEIMDLIISVEL